LIKIDYRNIFEYIETDGKREIVRNRWIYTEMGGKRWK